METNKIYYSDFLEEHLGKQLEFNGISFVHESQNKNQGLDFYLPKYDIYIEIKQFYSERILKQLSVKDNVILLQGKKAVDLFIEMISYYMAGDVSFYNKSLNE